MRARRLPATRRKRSSNRRRTAKKPAVPPFDTALERRIGELELLATQSHINEQELRSELAEAQARSDYYSRLFDSSPVGSLSLTAGGIIRDINEAGASLLRWDREKLIGESFARFVAKETLGKFLKHLRLSKFSDKPVTTELTLRTRTGVLLPVELVSSAAASEVPDKVAHRAVIIDISERRQAELALAETQRNYRNLVNSIQGVVWESNPATGEFTFVSQQAERLLGYPIESWLLEPDFWADRLHPDDRERVLRQREQALVVGRSFAEEFRMITAAGEVVWLRNNVSVLRREDGEVSAQGVMVNITELKMIEHALREEKRALETLHHIGTSLVAELDLEKLVRDVTEAGKQVTGAQFAAFSYKRLNGLDNGEFTLYASGAPQETFQRLPRPEHDPATPPAEAEREVIRIADLLQNQRVARPGTESARRPASLPVRSYLAVPVISRSGEMLGGLLFGHMEPGIFTERAQHLVASIAAEAAIALDNARLYHSMTKSEAHFRELAEAMPQIVWTAGPQGQFEYFNQRWFDYIGQPEGEGVGDWTAYLDPQHNADCLESWQTALKTSQPLQLECRLGSRNPGEYRWHLIRAVPIKDAEGRITRWFGTCTDIEDQKRAEQEVRHLNAALERRVLERTAQLEASNRELEAFSYSVSHDLRAPLRSIDAFSQLVREDYGGKLDAQGHQYLNLVSEASRQMARLIDDLLHLSRVTRTELRRQPVSLSDLATEIITVFRQLEPKRQVEVTIALDLTVSGDARLLRIVLDNLLNNAWKFTGKQPEPRIELGSETKDGQTVFFVRDNGAGFDMTYAGKLFGAFQRLHSVQEFPGHGIGLATVQRIISRHGGRIWAESAPGQGATFYFTLPSSAA